MGAVRSRFSGQGFVTGALAPVVVAPVRWGGPAGVAGFGLDIGYVCG